MVNYRNILSLAHNCTVDKLKSELTRIGEKQFVDEETIKVHYIVHPKTGDGLIHVAARGGNVECLQLLLSEFNVNVDQKNLEFKTALHEAAQFGQTEAVRLLLAAGAQVDSLKRADWTPLMLAATKTENIQCIKMLINAGSNLRVINKDGWTALHIAIRTGDLESVNLLVSADPSCLMIHSNNGRTVLHTASLAGHRDIVKLLMERSRSLLNFQDSCGNTPVMDAARAGHLDCVKELATEADLSLTDKMNRGIVEVTAQAGSLEVLKYLRTILDQSSITNATLHCAAREGHADIIKQLLDWEADPHKLDDQGRTPLFLSVSGQHFEAARLLLLAGSKTDIVDNSGNKLVSLARSQELINLLK